MGFAKPDPADKHNIAFVFNKFQMEYVLNLESVDFFGQS
jgi:hypothetical protein